jgi:hypothetical protein
MQMSRNQARPADVMVNAQADAPGREVLLMPEISTGHHQLSRMRIACCRFHELSRSRAVGKASPQP